MIFFSSEVLEHVFTSRQVCFHVLSMKKEHRILLKNQYFSEVGLKDLIWNVLQEVEICSLIVANCSEDEGIFFLIYSYGYSYDQFRLLKYKAFPLSFNLF